MMILGVAVLGNLNTATMSQKSLGLAFWRIVISAGILTMVMSVINVLTVSHQFPLASGPSLTSNLRQTFIFTDRKQGVSARHVRAYGAVAPQKVVSRNSSRRSFQLSLKREDSLPTYSPQPAMKRMTKRFSRFPLKISGPIHNKPSNNPDHLAPLSNFNDAASSRYSRDTAGLTVPDLAHHPAMYSGGHV